MESVFISYSHQDEKWKDRVVTHLKVLEKQGLLHSWNDRDITLGSDWLPKIAEELNKAKVVVLLISADFLTSDFILGTEVPLILSRRQSEGITVIPMIVRPCTIKPIPWLSKIQWYPQDGKPLSTLTKPKWETELANLTQLILSPIPPIPPIMI